LVENLRLIAVSMHPSLVARVFACDVA